MDDRSERRAALSRRGFLQSASAAGGALAAGLPGEAPAAARGAAPVPPPPRAESTRSVVLEVNGQPHSLRIEPRVTLLDALREHLGLMGTKKGCDRGQCGACTVLVDGERINACLTLAVMQEGRRITTIEGLGAPDRLHPMQAAFVEFDAFQCGYCTPGQICSAVALLHEARRGDASAVSATLGTGPVALEDAEIRERMSGNLCRCGAYPNVVAAVRFVADAVPRG